jgi:glycine/D-amino acid oxidase-like deaminating enzyme
VDPAGAYQPVSYWQQTVPLTPGLPLRERLDCDVAIIGGGYTGLSVAYHLKRYHPSLDVAVLERAVVGHGASGRNGGFAMPLLGWDLLQTAKAVGEETAGAAYRMMYDAVAHVKAIVAEHQIACDLEATGYLMINTAPVREAHARAECELARRLGFDHQWVAQDGLGEYIRCPQFRSGVFDPHPCIINPAKLARGLKSVVEAMGVRVYEQTPVTKLSAGAPVQIETTEGALRATQVVLAVNGYGGALGFMESKILPVHTYIVLTEPLSKVQLEAIGWHKKRASLETARNCIHYFRLTADNRIAFGGEDVALYPGGAFRDADPAIFEALKKRFAQYFPVLRDVAFTHQWGGTLGVTLDMFPSFGQSGPNGNVFHAAGYSGHGVALSNYAGRILAPEILAAAGIKDLPEAIPRPFFYGRSPQWLPPDPFRYLGLQAYRYLLRAQDRWQGV